MTEQVLQEYLQKIGNLLRKGQNVAAAALCDQLALRHPDSVPMQLMVSQVYQQLGNFDRMLETALRAATMQPDHSGARLRVIESRIHCGQIDAALDSLAFLEDEDSLDHRLMQELAEMYLHCSSHVNANRCYRRSVELQPDNAQYLFNLAASCVALGDIDRAEALFTQVIGIDPADLGAYQNRSMLKTWSEGDNHITELTGVLERLPDAHPGEVPLCYALAKEYEDLGDNGRSFEYLQRGAQRRRSMLSYRVETDVAAMARIREVFDATRLATDAKPTWQEGPLFILGLPRSGTTLVDRILSSHSQVASLGEINDLAFALIRLAAGPGGKLGMVERSARLDFNRLGELYRCATASYGRTAPRLIDKTPQNYLYLGLIHLALPGAKVIHLRRHPLDSCYAMYKTLFRMGYPFSYSLEDLGHYYLAYHRLMDHWRQSIPGSFLDLDYESLVDQQEITSRSVLHYCGLDWEDGCLAFHKNAAPAATASAVQVRQPVYRSSVKRWQAYAEQLEPLANFLTSHGIDCG